MRSGATGSPSGEDPPPRSVVRVVGELDLASASWVSDRIARAARDPRREVVVDLSGVSFVDCAGLGALLSAQAQLGRRLSLRAPSVAVVRLIELATLRAPRRPLRLVRPPVGAGATAGPHPTP